MKILTNSDGKAYLSQNGKVLKKNEPTLITKNITANGDYNATDDNADGYSEVRVDVPNPKGVIWTSVDSDGYPLTVDATSVRFTNNLFRYGDYVRTKEILLSSTSSISTYFICFQNYELTEINLPTEADRFDIDGTKGIDNSAFMQCYKLTLSNWQIPEGVTIIGQSSFEQCIALSNRIIPSTIETIQAKAFNRCESMTEVIFMGTPTTIANNALANCINLLNIYCPWSEGEVANAPWGATNATIHYNYTPS